MAILKSGRKKEKKEKEKRSKKEKKDRKGVEALILSELEVDGTVYKTTVPQSLRQNKKWKPKEIGDIESLITGVIKNIFVQKGDTVQKGDCLLLLEAMKMNNEILSPTDGIVQDIFVTESSNVPKGTLMVKIIQG